jgi:hypothetical protein
MIFVAIALFAVVVSKVKVSQPPPVMAASTQTVARVGCPNIYMDTGTTPSALMSTPVGITTPQVPAAKVNTPSNTFVAPVAEDVTSGLIIGLFA